VKVQARAIFAAVLLSGVAVTWAYDVDTHEELSEAAVDASALKKQTEILVNLGLRSLADLQTFPNYQGSPRTIVQLFRAGSRFEDGFHCLDSRPRNHFYDPLYRRGLQWGWVSGERSPDWALEDTKEYSGGLLSSQQDYSLRDARDYLYKALTSAREDERKRQFGLTFQTLGHVIHHLQDMAQPQHVRNDAHLDVPCLNADLSFENPSLYERWTNANRGESFFTGLLTSGAYAAVAFPEARDFWYNGAVSPSGGSGLSEFTNTNFLSAGTNLHENPDGTIGTDPRYRLPEWNHLVSDPVPLLVLLREEGRCLPSGEGGGGEDNCMAYDEAGICIEYGDGDPATQDPAPQPTDPLCALQGDIVFYGTTVTDSYRGASADNPRATTLSLFDQDLEAYDKKAEYVTEDGQVIPKKKVFTLNRFNFQAAYPHLIPKAVAYSAGLIDYFFRGRLDVEIVTSTGSELMIEVRNVSGVGKAFKDGKFELYYDATGGERRRLPIVQGEDVPALAHDAVTVVRAGKPKLSEVDLEKDSPLVLVYKGLIGEEEAVAAVMAEFPLSGFLVQPGFLPADGIQGVRHIYREDGQWKLGSSTRFVAGNVDWKGRYVGDKPSVVLSWQGSGRYLGDGVGREVYYNGRPLALAPGLVSGAVLTKDAAGRNWLVAVCTFDGMDVVYRRPFRRDDPATEPQEWQEMGRMAPGIPYRGAQGWYFNADGNEAQTIKLVADPDHPGSEKLVRWKLTIAGDTAQFQDLGNSDPIRTVTTENHSLSGDLWRCPEGSYSASYSVTTQRSGSFVIAVDYKRDAEVLARAIGSGSSDALFGRNAQWKCEYGYLSVLVRGTDLSQARGTTDFGFQIVWGSITLQLERRQGGGDWREEYQLPLATLSSEGRSSVDAITAQGLSIFDLRHDIGVVLEVASHGESRYTYGDGERCFSGTGADVRKYYATTGTSSLVFYEARNDGNNSWCVRDYLGLGPHHTVPELYDHSPAGVAESYVLPSHGNVTGAWFADADGNAIGVTPYLDIDRNSRRYQHLSGGKLEDLIPGGTSDSAYLPLGVIK
jgi:hypothetical protein